MAALQIVANCKRFKLLLTQLAAKLNEIKIIAQNVPEGTNSRSQ